MSSRSSRSSEASSRSSNTSRSASTYTSRRIPSTVGGYSQHDDRSLRDIQEEIERYDQQIANTEAAKQNALKTIRDAETRERTLAQERDRAQRKRVEMVQRLNSNALITGHSSVPGVIEERSPDDYIPHTSTPLESQSGSSDTSSKSKRPRYEAIAISRRARPKTIWGGPSWA